jgi:hypothetical protein
MSRKQKRPSKVEIEQMFAQCASDMRLRKNQRIDADYLAEEVSDRFDIFEDDPSIVLPNWIVTSAKEWLDRQDWYTPPE